MMSKEAMKLALEALENSVDLVREDAYQAEKLYGNYPTRQGKVNGLKVLADDHEKAITALREALAEQALDKKADNARELGLDYEPPTYTFKQSSELPITLLEMKPNYNITYYRNGKQIGVLDFNGPEMVFTGDADESAKVFFDFIAGWFKARLEQERADEREACAKVCEELLERPSGYQGTWEGYGKFKTQMTGQECATAIRARSNT
jgi:hypothetical protein